LRCSVSCFLAIWKSFSVFQPNHPDINLFFLQKVEKMYPGDRDRLRRMSIIEEGSSHQQVRMAYLAVVGCHCVNGVAALHSALVQSQLFPDFVDFFGAGKFMNVTNGVTPRRWLNQANPSLGKLITKTLVSEEWLKDLSLIAKVKAFAKDETFQKEWMAIKRQNKVRLADYIEAACGVTVSPDALFDIQVLSANAVQTSSRVQASVHEHPCCHSSLRTALGHVRCRIEECCSSCGHLCGQECSWILHG
jgi:glucan phosphorylase